MSNGYSKKIAQVVDAFLKEDDWKYSFDKKGGFYKFSLHIDGRMRTIQYLIDVKDDEIVVYGFSPICGDFKDAHMMASLAEFFTLANFGLRNGKFEMDYSDGEIRYCSYIDCDELIPSKKVVKNAVYCIASMFDRYSPGLFDIIFKDADAKECIKECEKAVDEEIMDLLSDLAIESEDEDIKKEIEQFLERIGITDDDMTPSESSSERVRRVKTTLFDTEGEGEDA